jgi:UDPglucose--hexose-1-phosphate uridylyltransferase
MTLRRDPITGRWIVNTEQAEQPEKVQALKEAETCPFCGGSEALTPPEIFALRPKDSKPDSPGWEVRVVPSFSPALRIEGELNRRGELLYDLMNAVGAHEIVIETPGHIANLADLELAQIEKVVKTYTLRVADLKKDERFRSVVVFKNYGGDVVRHSHSQIIATPVTPKNLKEELNGSKDYYGYKERCIYCDIIKQEMQQNKRIVLENEWFLGIAPFASRFPYEVWLLPKKHSFAFEAITDRELPFLALALKTILKKLQKLLNDPAYSFVLHSSPNLREKSGYWQTIRYDYHWHFEIMPQAIESSGFEWGTGFYLNPTTPEEVATQLRQVELSF